MEKEKLPIREILSLIIGEAIVSALVIGVFLILDKFELAVFDHTVVLGALLGSAVIIVNFLVLAIMANRVINNFLEARGNEELTEEEADELAKKHQGAVQNQIKLSFIIRMVVMVVTLIVAFLLDIFNVIATVIPIFMFRPILTLSELFGRKRGK